MLTWCRTKKKSFTIIGSFDARTNRVNWYRLYLVYRPVYLDPEINNRLTVYLTQKRPFENIVGKGEIACKRNFFFSDMFSTLSKTELIIFVTFNLSSALKCFQFGLVQNCVLSEWVIVAT